MAQCVVVGSGLTGLSLALFLARLGQTVTVLEAAPHPAPLVSGFTRAGCHFDTGFHCAGGLAAHDVLGRWLSVLDLSSLLGPNLRHTATYAFADGRTFTFTNINSVEAAPLYGAVLL